VGRGWVAIAVVCATTACGRGPFWYFGDEDDGDAEAEAVADCDRADFLFVIDDSPSMQGYQRRLVENFPVFLAGVERVVQEGTDLHVGVVTTDAYYGNPSPCEVPGGLVIETKGANSSRSVCGPYAEGANYMTAADDLEAAFECAAKVGTLGADSEQPLVSLLAAVDPNSSAAQCNAGFSRKDALLTVVILTDETDSSPGNELDYARDLADLEGGRSNVVVVALTAEDSSCANDPLETECYDSRLTRFTNWFEYGFMGSITGDYAEQFDQAVELVATACAGD
jgi:hypothetical protein